MDAATILELRPALTKYLHEFDSCMGLSPNRRHLRTYVGGQLGPLQRKSVEPIALAAGTAVRSLQEFMAHLHWDHHRLRDLHQRRVVRRHDHDAAIGIVDETSFAKKGVKTACVQRQHCGSRGKVDNCVVSVHLGYATPTFSTMLDGELFLPEHTWHADRDRCREAGIPDEIVYRSKCRIAMDLLKRSRGNGVRMSWLTFDEGYGSKPWFLRELDAMGQRFVGEVPKSFRVWTREPKLRARRHACDGQDADTAKLMVQTLPMSKVEDVLAHSPRVRELRWEKYVVNDSPSGPIVWEAIRLPIWLCDEDGVPTREHQLIICRAVLSRVDVKFFVGNAAPSVATEQILFVAFSRWHIERQFQDAKTDLGMDHFEMRRFIGIQRHLIVSCLSHAFLAEFCGGRRSKSPGDHGESGGGCRQAAHAAVDQRPTLLVSVG